MIIDIILLALSGAYAAHGVVTFINSKEEVTKLPEKVEEPISDTVQLIVELLREGKGWTLETGSSGFRSEFLYTHTSGVTVVKSYYQRITDYSAYIIDDEGKTKAIKCNKSERKLLGEEVAKYVTSRANAEQEDLARLLASRVVSGASVHPLLGNASGTSEDDASNVSLQGRISNNIVSTNYVHYSNGQIVYDKPEDSGSLTLSTALAKRYGFRGTMPERQIR